MECPRIQKGLQNKPYIRHPVWWACITAGIGVLGLSGWALSQRIMVTIIPESVTMAPVSALLFILLGISLFLCEYAFHDARFVIVQDALLIPPVIIGIWFLILSVFENSPHIHRYTASSDQLFLIAPESAMSPGSALLFPFSALGLYAHRRQFRYASSLGIIIFLAGMISSWDTCLLIPSSPECM
jgi:uncharacterized membrane protein YfcA